MRYQCIICVFVVSIALVNSQAFAPTKLDRFIVPYKFYRDVEFSINGRNSENPLNLKRARQINILQPEIPESKPFPCNVTAGRSLEPPKSVHELRPGDIDIIAALGDSLTAGNGVMATNMLQVLVENRGVSWSIGGQGTWRKFLTLPNIIKEFNPKLFGYSLRDSITTQKESQFNPAERGALSSELPFMAKILVKRITLDPRVDLKNHWKLITILIGANDFCLDICYHSIPLDVLKYHRQDLIEVLRILRNILPRTIVNLVPVPDVTEITKLGKKPNQCYTVNWIECYCMNSLQYKNKVNSFREILLRWQQIDADISMMEEFQTDDFAVVFQPFTVNSKIPLNEKNETDFTAFSQDCFHFSQKQNANVANSLWNNMLERVGSKTQSTNNYAFEKFLCPTDENPYIFTNANSRL